MYNKILTLLSLIKSDKLIQIFKKIFGFRYLLFTLKSKRQAISSLITLTPTHASAYVFFCHFTPDVIATSNVIGT